ncbi:hypothetical protein JW949_00520 [Candidatus Woesearchaeota archaeon]|nr:hypothetical protein [Candidatus Woesearchaeota archaeon]
MGEIKPEIYLVGSFYGFRDKLIEALPEYPLRDPRNHRQSCIAKLVIDDMNAAENCPVLLAVFPKNKDRGTATYAEIGASYAHGNYIIIVDEEDGHKKEDVLLRKVADKYFTDSEKAINFLNNGFELTNKPKKKIKSKYPVNSQGIIPVKKVYFCGEISGELSDIIDELSEKQPRKEFIKKSEDTHEDFKKIATYDLIVANFPKNKWWDRHAFFMIGGAYAHDISVLSVENKKLRYPPLQALVRRSTNSIQNMKKYLEEVNDLNVNKEASFMYDAFKREINYNSK